MSAIPDPDDARRREERQTREANRVGCLILVAFVLAIGTIMWVAMSKGVRP